MLLCFLGPYKELGRFSFVNSRSVGRSCCGSEVLLVCCATELTFLVEKKPRLLAEEGFQKSTFQHTVGQASGTHRRRDQWSISNERRKQLASGNSLPNTASHAAVVLQQNIEEVPTNSCAHPLNLKFVSVLTAALDRVCESLAAF